MRAFISVNLSVANQQAIAEFQKMLTNDVQHIRWTRPALCHFTLQFLGDITQETLLSLTKQLPAVGVTLPPINAELGGLGRFPAKGRLSILWVGLLKGESKMVALEGAVRQKLVEHTIPFDKKTFIPHLTIGRAQRNKPAWIEHIDAHQKKSLGTLEVRSFSLMESVLTPSGPIYTEKLNVPLVG